MLPPHLTDADADLMALIFLGDPDPLDDLVEMKGDDARDDDHR